MKIFKKIGLIAFSILIGVASIFILIPSKSSNSAQANTVSSNYVFDGSNTINVVTNYSSNNVTDSFGILSIRFRLEKVSSGVKVTSSGYGQYQYSHSASFSNLYPFSNETTLTTTSYDSTNVPLTGSGGYFNLAFTLSSLDFNCNVYKVRYYSQTYNNNQMITFITYYDVNDNTLVLRFYCYGTTYFNEYTKLALDDRYYFFVSDLTDNQFYEQGFANGKNEGLSQGENIGYQNGYDVGFQQGEISGFNEGVESANNYTFLSLIGAVVDAPVSVFKTMFNFDLLGVNLKDFFLAILTFCGITLLVKFALMKG